METQQVEMYKKLAKLILYETPQNQIAMALKLSDGRISQIVQTEEFKEILAEISTEVFDSQQMMNQSWDAIENLAVCHVYEAMQANPDPEFALKVATVANRATRRGQLNHMPLQGSAGVRAVLQLNATFVNKLQQNFNIGNRHDRGNELLEHKQRTDYMLPGAVEQLLRPPSEVDVQLIQSIQSIEDDLAGFEDV